MENERKKLKIKKIENNSKRFKIKKIEYYEELDKTNQEINSNLLVLGAESMAIILTSTTMNNNSFIILKFVQIVLLFLNIGLAIDSVIDLIDAILRQTILESKIEELNDLLKAKGTKKLVLSKNGEIKGFRR